ncbi:MAG: hypothetical protein RJQ09_20880 [Cyclobacteriaceae bacterium]
MTASLESRILTYPVFWSVFIAAIAVRLLYHSFGVIDFWGDSFHNVYINWATANNNWVYTDYMGREVVWMPFYRYLSGFFMYSFNSYSLTVAYVLNGLIGATTCGLTASIIEKYTSKITGYYSGLILAVLPWFLAYNHMHMPETLCALLLLLMVVVWDSEKYWWLLPIAFLGVLTRNEVTFSMIVFGVILLLQKNWRAAAPLAIGGSVGLVIWGWWCYNITGDFFWWITERGIGSVWTNEFRSKYSSAQSVLYPAISVLITFPFILIIFYKLKQISLQFLKQSKQFFVAVFVLFGTSWLAIFILQFKFLGYPDPKYYLITLPLTVIAFAIIVYKTMRPIKTMRISLIISLMLLGAHIPVFKAMHLSGINIFQVGYYLKNHPLATERNIWNDFTTAWYYSDIDPNRIYSSLQLAPKLIREDANYQAQVEQNMIDHDIRYLVAAPASFTFVNDIFHGLSTREPFVWRSFRFDPVYIFNPENEAEQSKYNFIEKQIVGNFGASFWRLTKLKEH